MWVCGFGCGVGVGVSRSRKALAKHTKPQTPNPKPGVSRCFRKALAMHPKHTRSLCNYAYMLHVGKRDFAKAEELYKKALTVCLCVWTSLCCPVSCVQWSRL